MAKCIDHRRVPRAERGFTLIETAVVMAAFTLIMAIAFGLFTQLGTVAGQNEQIARSQAGARVAIEDIERAMRSAGAEVDLARGQRNFVWAGPYQVAFNANVNPADDPMGDQSPAALPQGAGVPNDTSPFYVPAADFATGAETIVFTVDSNGNGVIDAGDKADDPEERSENPNDYVLYRNIHGSDAGAVVVDRAAVAVIRGPEADDGDYVPPLFTYWIDHDDDRTTPPQLFGDTDGDGEISAAEFGNLGNVDARNLVRIERVGVHVTAETASPDRSVTENGGYERVEVSTEVKVRQVPRSSGIVFGSVFRDVDGDGTRGPTEAAISGVTIRASTGQETRSNATGEFVLVVPPGSVTITEVDPTGYSSSTDNSVVVDAYPGSYTQVDFGDMPAIGMAVVTGRVFDDVDEDGIDSNERGIVGVKIFSDTGEFTFTGADGSYVLDVPVGIRAIGQVDSTGYTSTTPNSVSVNLRDTGATAEANFGDVRMDESGTVEGYVYEDLDRDGVRGRREPGVPGATIIVGEATTESDAEGFFSLTVPTGTYTITEVDPPGFTSTTPNDLAGREVVADQVLTVMFGDIVREDLDFEVIELADTEKALSITSGDLEEDNAGDPDLVLGTRYSGGANNLLVWENQRRNSRTPNAAIFDTAPSQSRANPADVTSLVGADLDGDGDLDVITGLATSSEPDVNVWHTDGGAMGDQATFSWHTYNGQVVGDLQKADVNRDGFDDLVVAVEQVGALTGQAEIWRGDGDGYFERMDSATLKYRANGMGVYPLGRVTAARVADLNGNGRLDAVVASVDGPYQSSVHVFEQSSLFSGVSWLPVQSFEVRGEITQLRLMDLVEDDQGDVDIIIASATSETSGHVEIWHQDRAGGHFGLAGESSLSANDLMPTGGAPLSLEVLRLDNDIFPDTMVGTRRGSGFEGTVEYALGFGHLLSEPIPITETSIGAVLTMTDDDFNLDGVSDLAVGTQNSNTQGKIFVFFRR